MERSIEAFQSRVVGHRSRAHGRRGPCFGPTEEDVAGGVRDPLAMDDAFTVVVEDAGPQIGLEHRCLRLFRLEYQGVLAVPPTRRNTVALVPTLPTPTTLRAMSTNR